MLGDQIHQEEKRKAAAIISDDDYTRLRLEPRRGHNFYLHLQDLRNALLPCAQSASGRLLDYGCGSSPYRSLFLNTTYLRADYTPSPDLDYAVQENQRIEAADESFDCVLSTQVLEHVQQPVDYLLECFRLLKPGGKLILTTHGLFEEHGCPYDFRRWTADGLRGELEETGFRIDKLQKLTAGARAAGFLFRQYGIYLMSGRRSIFGLLHWFFFRRTDRFYQRIDRWLDRKFSSCSIVDASQSGYPLYIALLVLATKPADAPVGRQ